MAVPVTGLISSGNNLESSIWLGKCFLKTIIVLDTTNLFSVSSLGTCQLSALCLSFVIMDAKRACAGSSGELFLRLYSKLEIVARLLECLSKKGSSEKITIAG